MKHVSQRHTERHMHRDMTDGRAKKERNEHRDGTAPTPQTQRRKKETHTPQLRAHHQRRKETQHLQQAHFNLTECHQTHLYSEGCTHHLRTLSLFHRSLFTSSLMLLQLTRTEHAKEMKYLLITQPEGVFTHQQQTHDCQAHSQRWKRRLDSVPLLCCSSHAGDSHLCALRATALQRSVQPRSSKNSESHTPTSRTSS